MSREKDKSVQMPENKTTKRKISLARMSVLLVLCFFTYFIFHYIKVRDEIKAKAQAEVSKLDNVESEIFDLSEEYKVQSEEQDPSGLSDIVNGESIDKDSDFVYRSLLKNQMQINDLKNQTQSLKDEILKYKNQERMAKMIFSYVELRQKIFSNATVKVVGYEEDLKNFETLSILDDTLQNKVAKLKPLLGQFVGQEKLNQEFDALIVDLVALKSTDNAGIISKIRHNISKLVIIRKTDENNAVGIDAAIAKSERLLREQNYQEVLNILVALDPVYHDILNVFLNDLNAALEVQKIDQEILSYLKTLS
jgi:hypothetical protein